jgi:hypothetical protein
MITPYPSGRDKPDHLLWLRDCKVYFQKFNVDHRLRGMRAACDPAASPD